MAVKDEAYLQFQNLLVEIMEPYFKDQLGTLEHHISKLDAKVLTLDGEVWRLKARADFLQTQAEAIVDVVTTPPGATVPTIPRRVDLPMTKPAGPVSTPKATRNRTPNKFTNNRRKKYILKIEDEGHTEFIRLIYKGLLAKEWTPRAFAAVVGVGDSAVSRWFRYEAAPRPEQLEKIRKAYGGWVRCQEWDRITGAHLREHRIKCVEMRARAKKKAGQV
jgi:DNA-binding transcriptional regulator YdaS (Cro superfamily)